MRREGRRQWADGIEHCECRGSLIAGGGKEKIKKRQRKRLVSLLIGKHVSFSSNARDARAGHVDLVGLADPPSQMISKGHKEERPS